MGNILGTKKNNQSTIKLFLDLNGINIAFIVIGIMLIFFARVPYGYMWGENILDGIGSSCIAAAIMTIFINNIQYKKDRKRIHSIRKLYFKTYYISLVQMVQRILWFDERWEEKEFNWNLPPNEYGSLNFMLFSYQKYKSNVRLNLAELQH